MAAHAATGSALSPSHFSLSAYNQSNPIDLTLEDDEVDQYNSSRFAKRPRTENSSPQPYTNHQAGPSFIHHNPSPGPSNAIPSMSPFAFYNQKPSMAMLDPSLVKPGFLPGSNDNAPSKQSMYHPAFAGPSPSAFFVPRQQHPPGGLLPPSRSPSYTSSPSFASRPLSQASDRQVIDLTGSPSPPPQMHQQRPVINSLPPELPPKTPVCIGQLTVTALILYPVPYLVPHDPGSGEPEWASARLQYEHNPSKPGGSETIHIKAPHQRGLNGETIAGEAFGVIEQKVATSLGPMLGKGLIRLDAQVRKGPSNVRSPRFPMLMKLTFTSSSRYSHCSCLCTHPRGIFL